MNFGRPARTVVTVEDKETHNPLLGATVSLVSRADTLRGTTVKEDFYRIMAVYRCDRIFSSSIRASLFAAHADRCRRIAAASSRRFSHLAP